MKLSGVKTSRVRDQSLAEIQAAICPDIVTVTATATAAAAAAATLYGGGVLQQLTRQSSIGTYKVSSDRDLGVGSYCQWC
ncbi:hypothetical protein J6590_013942 [Homalodisca vitripennis]|nr:hypothetical protein J6590_013942 [Homalodisca vitripennis]